jgi:hypothetical protein
MLGITGMHRQAFFQNKTKQHQNPNPFLLFDSVGLLMTFNHGNNKKFIFLPYQAEGTWSWSRMYVSNTF